MMAMVQVRRPSIGQRYYRRKLAEGKSPKEALLCLKAAALGRRLPVPGCRSMPPSDRGSRWHNVP
jgi:hypothetical protein